MKKFVVRILGIISVLIFGYQQFCYADVVSISPTGILFVPLTFLFGFIGVIVLIISAISFFSLKATVKKQSMPEYDSEKLITLTSEEIEKEKNKIQRRFYVWSIILSITGLIYLGLYRKISEVIFFIPIILFVISIIVRLNKNKKLSNIICGISVALVCIIALWVGISNKMRENYKNTYVNEYIIRDLLLYEGERQRGSSVKGLIQNVRSKVADYEEIKIMITYISDINQTTVNVSTDNSQEITNLRNEIKDSKTYKVEIQSDSDVCNIIITSND